MKPIKILLSDFQFLTRVGLIEMIKNSKDFELVGENNNSDKIIDNLIEMQPDVLMMDYENQSSKTIELLKHIIHDLGINVLIITNDIDKINIQNLLGIGIKGIITKACSKLEIINAVQAISDHKRFYCNKILDIVMMTHENTIIENCEPTELSPREYEVLQLITKGRKTVEIANELNVSIHTINSHRKNILKKLNLRSPAELIVYALETRLVNA